MESRGYGLIEWPWHPCLCLTHGLSSLALCSCHIPLSASLSIYKTGMPKVDITVNNYIIVILQYGYYNKDLKS